MSRGPFPGIWSRSKNADLRTNREPRWNSELGSPGRNPAGKATETRGREQKYGKRTPHLKAWMHTGKTGFDELSMILGAREAHATF